MKKLLILSIFCALISCNNKSKTEVSQNQKEYTFTLYMDKYDPIKEDFVENNIISKVNSENDTTAYLTALTDFYNEKVKQRAMQNYGQPKSFLIVDKYNIDLSLKLSERLAQGLETQVKSKPPIKKMLDEYMMDSLSIH